MVSHVGNNSTPPYTSSIQNLPLPNVVTAVKDLGVMFDVKLKFNVHINKIVVKALARSNLIIKCFLSRDPKTLFMAFVTYVRPILEYASCVWSPCSLTYIKKVESVQRRFTKRLKGMTELQYSERLAITGAETLELRRLKADLTYIYKIMFGILDVEHGTFDIKLNGGTSTRSGTHRHAFCVEETHGRINARRNFVSLQVARVWNCLPANATNFKTVHAFKEYLNKIDFSSQLTIK